MGKRATEAIARQREILEHLQSVGETTVPAMRDALEIPEKTIWRDLEALRAWGHAITETRQTRPGRGLGPSLIRLEAA